MPMKIVIEPRSDNDNNLAQTGNHMENEKITVFSAQNRGINLVIPVEVLGRRMNAVVDTAAQVSVVNSKLVDDLLQDRQPLPARLWGIGSQDIPARLFKDIPVDIGEHDYKAPLYVADISDDMLLGIDFFYQYGVEIDFSRCELTIQGDKVKAFMVQDTNHASHPISRVVTKEKIRLEPNTRTRIRVALDEGQDDIFVFSPSMSASESLMPCTLNCPGNSAVADFINDTDAAIIIQPDTVLGTAVGGYVLTSPRRGHRRIRQMKSTYERRFKKLPDHLKDLYDKSQKNLTEDQKFQLKMLLIDFRDTFAKHDLDLGHFTEIQHIIPLIENARPIKEKMRRTPLNFEKEEEKTLKAMLDAGVIQPSCSPWASAPVLVRKKEGGVRWCLDYRQLNDLTIKDQYPLPLISQCYDTLQGNVYMSTLDMAAGYWQIGIAPEDREKTAFITKYGLFEHVRMSMGLCNAPSTFQRAMNLVLRGLTWKTVLAFLDDVLVLGRSFEEHLENLREVLYRFQNHNLKLKPRKCSLFQTEIKFLGRIVSGSTVSVDPASIECVKDWPTPNCTKEVESFLGFANYNREHVPNLAQLAEPLYAITGKKPFVWKEEHTLAFEKIKDALTRPVALSLPTPDDPFVLDVDASNVAVGAQLSQIRDGVEVPVSYGSKSLTATQRRYCATRKELLARIVFTRQYRHYLLGRPFTIRTDHSSLVWLTRFRNLSGQLARWMEELQQYAMQIVHRPGVKHQNSDALSRIRDDTPLCKCYEAVTDLSLLPCKGCDYCINARRQWEDFERDVDDVVPLYIPVVRAVHTDQNWADILQPHLRKEKQAEDSDLVLLKKWLGDPPTDNEIAAESPRLKVLWTHRDRITLVDGVLWYSWLQDGDERQLFIIPAGMKESVLKLAHDNNLAGHFGIDKTYERVSRNFYWPGMRGDIETHVKACFNCNRSKHLRRRFRSPLQELTMGAPMEKLHMDIMGPLPKSTRNNIYVLVIICQFSKWVELVALPNQLAETVANAVIDSTITRFGCPKQIFTDRGTNFCSSLFCELCRRLGIDKKQTTAYRPSANGQAERMNRVLGQALRSILLATARKDQREWDDKLQLIAGAIRCTVNRSTGFTPNKLMLGREVTQPLELMCGVQETRHSTAEYVKLVETRMAEAHEAARRSLKETQRRQKRSYDIQQHTTRYQEGDAVLMTNSASKIGQSRKLQPLWLGPFLVTQVISPTLCKIASQRKSFIAHHDRLRPCKDKVLPLWLERRRLRLEGITDILDETLGSFAFEPIYCYCRKPDDGSLMVICEGCMDWFHVVSCLKMSEEEIDAIDFFFCKECSN